MCVCVSECTCEEGSNSYMYKYITFIMVGINKNQSLNQARAIIHLSVLDYTR